MNHNINREKRLLIPKWRSFETTLKLGELSFKTNSPMRVISSKIFEEKKQEWEKNRDKISAMELVTLDRVYNLEQEFRDSEKFKSAEEFLNMANDISLIKDAVITSTNENVDTIKRNLKCYDCIRSIKSRLSKVIKNPIDWVNLAYYYTLLNQKNKAIKSIEIALQLDINNRYVIRSAVRLYIHFGETEKAYNVFRKTDLTFRDTWVNSAYIAVAQLRGKPINKLKTSMQFIDSSNYSPFDITELASSIATMEIENGDDKKGKKLLKKSIEMPNDNSAAQIQWLSKNRISLPTFEEQLDYAKIQNNYEYNTILHCYMQDFEKAIKYAEDWSNDERYSSEPNNVMMSIYNTIYKDYAKVEKLANELLKNGEKDIGVKCNLAYALIRQNKIEEAEKLMKDIENDTSEQSKIVSLADKGLICFMNHDYEGGRTLYEKAIKESENSKLKALRTSAIAHLAEIEKYNKTSKMEEAIKRAKEQRDNNTDPLMIHFIEEL